MYRTRCQYSSLFMIFFYNAILFHAIAAELSHSKDSLKIISKSSKERNAWIAEGEWGTIYLIGCHVIAFILCSYLFLIHRVMTAIVNEWCFSPCAVSRYANKGSYDKAISDFETALKERPNHANATNYLSETLVAYAKQWVPLILVSRMYSIHLCLQLVVVRCVIQYSEPVFKWRFYHWGNW